MLALFATACVDDGELGGPSVGGASAVSVGDVALSHGDLAAMVDRWAANPQFIGIVAGFTDVGEPGRRPADLVNFVLSFWVQAEQARAIVPSVDPSFDIAAETDAAIQGLGSQFPTFANYDAEFQSEVAEAAAYQSVLASMVGQGTIDFQVPRVEVNPRYGSTIDVGAGLVAVQPPEGPRAEAPTGLTGS